ncbi:MAG: hypothetical protein AB7D57_00965 [Desulfovibrionaceae bacterium]
MPLTDTLLILFSLVELALLVIVVAFFLRLRRSEALISKVQAQQESFLNKLRFNAQMEQEMVETFGRRQTELAALDEQLERRAQELKKLVDQAASLTRSPRVLRQVILEGHDQGKTPAQLAKATGLSVDEVELILEQA